MATHVNGWDYKGGPSSSQPPLAITRRMGTSPTPPCAYPGWMLALEAWIRSRPADHQHALRGLFCKMVGNITGPALDLLERKCSPFVSVAVVVSAAGGAMASWCELLAVLLDKCADTIAQPSVDPAKFKLQLERLMVFCMAWAVGSALGPEDRARFDAYVRWVSAEACPEAGVGETVYEYVVDDRTLEWVRRKPPACIYPSQAKLGLSVLLGPATDSTRVVSLLLLGGPIKASASTANLVFGQPRLATRFASTRLLDPCNLPLSPLPGAPRESTEAGLDDAPFGGRNITCIVDDWSVPGDGRAARDVVDVSELALFEYALVQINRLRRVMGKTDFAGGKEASGPQVASQERSSGGDECEPDGRVLSPAVEALVRLSSFGLDGLRHSSPDASAAAPAPASSVSRAKRRARRKAASAARRVTVHARGPPRNAERHRVALERVRALFSRAEKMRARAAASVRPWVWAAAATSPAASSATAAASSADASQPATCSWAPPTREECKAVRRARAAEAHAELACVSLFAAWTLQDAGRASAAGGRPVGRRAREAAIASFVADIRALALRYGGVGTPQPAEGTPQSSTQGAFLSGGGAATPDDDAAVVSLLGGLTAEALVGVDRCGADPQAVRGVVASHRAEVLRRLKTGEPLRPAPSGAPACTAAGSPCPRTTGSGTSQTGLAPAAAGAVSCGGGSGSGSGMASPSASPGLMRAHSLVCSLLGPERWLTTCDALRARPTRPAARRALASDPGPPLAAAGQGERGVSGGVASRTIEIFVKMPEGDTITLTVDRLDSVEVRGVVGGGC